MLVNLTSGDRRLRDVVLLRARAGQVPSPVLPGGHVSTATAPTLGRLLVRLWLPGIYGEKISESIHYFLKGKTYLKAKMQKEVLS